MPVLLDGQPLDVASPGLAGVLDAGRARAEASGRVIVEVVIDGEPAGADLLDNPTDEAVDGADIRLASADPVTLVASALSDAADALEAAGPGHAEIAANFQAGEQQAALAALGETLHLWQVAQDVFAQGWTLLGRDPLRLPMPADSGYDDAEAMIHGLVTQLHEIRRALGDSDFTAVADVVGYELEPMAARWARVLRSAAEAARSQDGGPGPESAAS
ncbi:MAG: hypothetical protein AAGB48_10370 [Planctomycetota bacterium]